MKQGWEIKKLGEVCTIERGGSPRPIQAYITESDDGINWIKIGDATDGSKYITSTKEKIKPEGMKKSRFVHKGDFILSNSMSFGRPYILAVDGCIHDGWLVIHDDNNRFDKNYLYYYLGSPNIYNEFKRLAVGGVVNNLNSELVRSVNVCIPPREEQERIVAELDYLSGVIEKKKQQLKELDALAQSIFYTMFGNPITNEKGWEVKKLGEVANSVNYGTSSPATEGGYYTYIRMNNLTYSGYLDLNDAKKIDVSENEMEKCIVRKGDILFNRTNSKDLVGKTALFDLDEEMIIAGYIIRVRVNTDVVLPIYVVRYMNTPFMKNYFRNLCKGAVNQANINSKELKAIPILMPPLTPQQEFADKIEAIEKQKELIKESIKETETLFNARMDYYFN